MIDSQGPNANCGTNCPKGPSLQWRYAEFEHFEKQQPTLVSNGMGIRRSSTTSPSHSMENTSFNIGASPTLERSGNTSPGTCSALPTPSRNSAMNEAPPDHDINRTLMPTIHAPGLRGECTAPVSGTTRPRGAAHRPRLYAAPTVLVRTEPRRGGRCGSPDPRRPPLASYRCRRIPFWNQCLRGPSTDSSLRPLVPPSVAWWVAVQPGKRHSRGGSAARAAPPAGRCWRGSRESSSQCHRAAQISHRGRTDPWQEPCRR